jgi:hypothetical protein
MTKRRVSIAEANELARQGTWIDNPKYDVNDHSRNAEPKLIFKAKYIVHHRPEPHLRESEQYATVEDAS